MTSNTIPNFNLHKRKKSFGQFRFVESHFWCYKRSSAQPRLLLMTFRSEDLATTFSCPRFWQKFWSIQIYREPFLVLKKIFSTTETLTHDLQIRRLPLGHQFLLSQVLAEVFANSDLWRATFRATKDLQHNRDSYS
ncbi:hypothetical protein AVEN_26420-1 [Araneus ventricosus]|uniref:Uncharacterized protein n=1 Tax=Araneus ventricosus TaxID=182803 RepID=A0A4Y2PKD0_ARAVE|nr:hypothetical protein AVEN_26420-1 [Araneus ventricosus]